MINSLSKFTKNFKLLSVISKSHQTLSVQQKEIIDSNNEFSVLKTQNETNYEIKKNVNEEIENKTTGRLFAVVHMAGKQRKVTTEDIIVLDKDIEADIGQRIRLNKILLIGSSNFSILGRPILREEIARVEATVMEKTLSHGIISFWYKRRKNVRLFNLRRKMFTFLRINSIQLNKVD